MTQAAMGQMNLCARGYHLVLKLARTIFTTFFSETKPVGWNTVKVADKVQFGKFFQKMLANGIYLAPSQFEAGFISTLYTDEIIDKTIEAVTETFRTW